ncbi:hypothetical protein [Pseudonocardia dioxanivorans]|uniref:hypothetical protein n=1 Tax=Pseudonocardia dioxanivorans TaxID=240495 RepID=UPI0005A209C0|nr:hypothetical protein [Pseudonocardia dioxanivorans]
MLFGQRFTWPDGPTLIVLAPEPDATGHRQVELRLRITAGASGVDPATDLHLDLTARGQRLAPQQPPSSGTWRAVGLPATALPAGTSVGATLEFAAPPDQGGWQCTATLRGSPLVVTYSEDI